MMRNTGLLLACVLCVGASLAEEATEGLDGKAGKLFKVNPEKRSLEFLKETEYDPKTGIGKSRFTVHWSEEVKIEATGERKSFDGIKGPVIASFHGIDEANAKAMKNGESFEARVATLYFGAGDEMATGPEDGHLKVFGWFTPDEGGRKGTIKVDGKEVPVSLRQRFWRIYDRTPLSPSDLTKGFWTATLAGEEIDGKFVASRMEVQALPDPRTTDNPKLPRVLVIGDSISMNYHETAKGALKGVANYHRNEGNAFSVIHGVNNAELWLGNYKEKGFHWDVVQFNHGMHDLKQAYDKDTGVFGEYAVPLEKYKAELEKLIGILKRTGAELIWCSTTPVPNDNMGQYARRAGAEDDFNQAALEVMKKHPEIIVNDLAGTVDDSSVFDNWRKQNDVHFYKIDEQETLGMAVAKAVRTAIKAPR